MSGHQHEVWQVRTRDDGKRYCAACGDLMSLREDMQLLAQEFDRAVGGTLAYTHSDGRSSIRRNAHDQIMYLLSLHPEN